MQNIPSTGYIEIDSYKLCYRIEGVGPDALVIGSALYYPRSFSKELRKNLRLIFIDWRGFSESESSTKTSFDLLLDDIEIIRKKLEIKTCLIIGHSAHAFLALEYAKKYPEAVSHVVMIGISPSLHPKMASLAELHWQKSASPERKAALQKKIIELPDEELNKLPPSERFVAWYIRRDPQAWYDFNFDSSWLWKDVHPNMILFDYLYGVALRDIDITSDLEKFDKPVFLALGLFDFIVAPAHSWDSIKPKFKDLTIQIFDQSGHSPQYEEASLFDKSLLEWILSHSKKKKIVVTPYNSNWPIIFNEEAFKIKEALGSNCLSIHHVGSTSVPGLIAKPVIDMIGVVKEAEKTIQPLESLGFKYKGEYNIPMRFFFNRSEGVDTNLHVYEDGHPEIELNLLFRDYLRNHPEARDEYAILKENLLKEESSHEKNNSPFTGYNLGKDAFIRKILKATHFQRLRIVKCTHYAEWDAVKTLRQKYFFDSLSCDDSYEWTFDHHEHTHLIFYQGVEIVGYAHIQFLSDRRAALRIFIIDKPYRHHGWGSHFLHLCELWLKKQGFSSLHKKAKQEVIQFYRKNGYKEMPFNDPKVESSCNLALGKTL